VLFVPYNQGVFLISDRQSTKADGTKEVWDKIYLIKKSNAIIGLSGSSEGTRSIAQELIDTQNEKPFVAQYIDSYRKFFHMVTMDTKEKIVEALIIIKSLDSIQPYKFIGEIQNLLNLQNPSGIGTGEHIIRPQLVQNTNIVTFEMALEFGKTLIEYASRVSLDVGSPTQFGFCLGVVPFNGEIINQVLEPQQVTIDKMLYRFT
jgi:hypothetical protein